MEPALRHVPVLEDTSKLQRAARQAERLFAINVRLSALHDPETLLPFIIETAAEVLGCEAASLLLFDEAEQTLRFAAATGSDAEEMADISVPLTDSLAGTIFSENRPLVVERVAQDARHFALVDEQMAFQTRSLVGVPLRIGEEPIGVLEGLNKHAGSFTPEDVEVLSVIAAQAAVALRNARQTHALERANARLSRFDELKSSVLALASHELRTPLSTILGYGAILKEEADAPALIEHAETVLEAAEKMKSVIEAMTHMDALRSGMAWLNTRPATLQRVLEKVRSEAAALPEARGRTLRLDLPERPLTLEADPDRLHLLFVNLLENALQFSPQETPVEVRACLADGKAHVAVIDQGIGLPQEELSRIFEEFYQVEDHLTRTHGGLGLGLTIARELTHLHGGRIRAESEGPGQGTTVHVHLPTTPARSFDAFAPT